ncbi:hypothetical protein [Rickettsia canadensis]|uniref:Uncharacterized protein n=1 Tax=Rickettsia canadensis str. CA410 TaxID=1105107 RepID=A0ABM5MT08_RICCA|nr:hypothetical protein [Rickettsia canadensis]AFB21518.1 hypothetical protein RCA_04845 [Rickettsia canadensis str. CA410]
MTIISSGKNSIITLTGYIDPGIPNTGLVEINAKNTNIKLIIDSIVNRYVL